MTIATDRFTPEDLQRMKEEVFEVNTTNGWFDEDRHFEEGIALTHSEIAEMFEAYRDHGMEDMTDKKCLKSFEEDPDHLCKPEGVGSEAADILIRLLDEAHRQNVDMLGEPWTPRDGDLDLSFGQHCARLHRVVSKWDENVARLAGKEAYSQSLTQRTMSVGWSMAYSRLVFLCGQQDIDLPGEYTRKIAYNRTRGYRHGGKRI